MGWKEITSGDKVGRALSAKFVKSKKGTLGLEVNFLFHEPNVNDDERLSWVGWLSPDAIERTMETLVSVLGFNGEEACDAQGNLTHPKALDYTKEVKLVVELEEYTGKDGTLKTAPKVKWVNSLGGSKYANTTPETVKSELKALGFKAAYLAAKQANGPAPLPNRAPQFKNPPAMEDEDAIPF